MLSFWPTGLFIETLVKFEGLIEYLSFEIHDPYKIHIANNTDKCKMSTLFTTTKILEHNYSVLQTCVCVCLTQFVFTELN